MHNTDMIDVEAALRSALSDKNAYRATQTLRRVISDGERQVCRPDSTEHATLRATMTRAYTALANVAPKYAERFRCRGRALTVASDGLRQNPTSGILVLAWSEAVVNWGYDSLTPPDRARIQMNLARAWRNCRAALDVPANDKVQVALLSQWSSVHRCQAALFGPLDGRQYIRHALSISEANHAQNPTNALAQIDYGLTLWSSARFAGTEDDFYDLTQRAENRLQVAHANGSPIATLSLARLYRQTYRPIQAIEAFKEYANREPQIRLVYPECHVAGEAATMLLHREIDRENLAPLLDWTSHLLSSALEAGYVNARLLVPIARIRYALGDLNSSTYFLRQIMPDGHLDWQDAIEVARKALRDQDTDLLHSAFALGIADGLVWNSLGTFINETTEDEGLALDLYDEAAQLSPGSPVVHTNIARLLLERNNSNDTPRIERHLELAGIHSDFSFRWWRPLRNRLAEKLAGRSVPSRGYSAKRDRESINRLYQEFLALERDDSNPHVRGAAFQELFFRLLRLTYGTDRSSGSLSLGGIQSDASFMRGTVGYRAEISWDSRPNDRSEVDKLISRLDRAIGARGLLVSMSGFTEGVTHEIDRQKSSHIILTLGPDEVRSILRGTARFESILEAKEAMHFLASFA